jgi:hypothetical protein
LVLALSTADEEHGLNEENEGKSQQQVGFMVVRRQGGLVLGQFMDVAWDEKNETNGFTGYEDRGLKQVALTGYDGQ